MRGYQINLQKYDQNVKSKCSIYLELFRDLINIKTTNFEKLKFDTQLFHSKTIHKKLLILSHYLSQDI